MTMPPIEKNGTLTISVFISALMLFISLPRMPAVRWITALRRSSLQACPRRRGGLCRLQGGRIPPGQLLEVLERVDPERLPRREQFAYYINAYNAGHQVDPDSLSGSQVHQGSRQPLPVALEEGVRADQRRTVTLDHIEHDILRPRFKDPRVHFAVNCASKSCPPLLSEPYRGQALKAQLTRVTSDFLNQPANSRLEGDRLWVSSIFKWFAEDFNRDVIGSTSPTRKAT